jgi:methylmalonyl-CoA/ethylmalonyl-CoA epimerase
MYPIFSIHHIGYAVCDLDKAQESFSCLGYKKISEKISDTERNVNGLMMKMDNFLIELLAIFDNEKKSPLDFLFGKKFFPGNGIPYHICYQVENITEVIKYLKKSEFILMSLPQKAPILNNHNVAFLYSQNIGLIELYEK